MGCDSIIQKLDTSSTTNKSNTFDIIRIGQLLGFQHPTVDAATEVVRFVIMCMRKSMKQASQSDFDSHRQQFGHDQILPLPFSIFERALVSNILGEKIISMALEEL